MKTIFRLLISALSLLHFSQIAQGADTYSLTASNNTNINITSTQSNLTVATIGLVDDTSNSVRTYSVSVTSQNGGLLNSTAKTNSGSAGNYLKNYSIGFSLTTGAALTPASPSLSMATIGTVKTLFFIGGEQSKSIGLAGTILFSLTGTPAAQLYSGTYSDVLTFEFTRSGGTTQSFTLNLTAAIIADTITLSVVPTAAASNLPLNTTQTNLNVGSISITANCQNGYLLKVSSSNGGLLQNTTAVAPVLSTDQISYGLSFAGSALTLSKTATTFKTVSTATLYATSTLLGSLTMNYSGVSNSSRRAGTYQDVLTFTLQSQ